MGSRHWHDFDEFRRRVKLDRVTHIVSGMAPGVDSMALRLVTLEAGKVEGLYFPEWEEAGDDFTERAHARNQKIVDHADELLAFPCQHSRGTYDTIRRARKRGIKVYNVPIDCGRADSDEDV